jgi:hypothetical protein
MDAPGNLGSNQDRRLGAISAPVLALVAIGYGTPSVARQIRDLGRKDHRGHDGTEQRSQDSGSDVLWKESAMSFGRWLRDQFVYQRPRDDEKFREVLRLTGEVADSAHSLNEKMKAYARSKDPFVAMIADLYNQHQVNEIYKGPE